MSEAFMCGCTRNHRERTYHFCSREHEDEWRSAREFIDRIRAETRRETLEEGRYKGYTFKEWERDADEAREQLQTVGQMWRNEALEEATSIFFEECQPNNGDLFSRVDARLRALQVYSKPSTINLGSPPGANTGDLATPEEREAWRRYCADCGHQESQPSQTPEREMSAVSDTNCPYRGTEHLCPTCDRVEEE